MPRSRGFRYGITQALTISFTLVVIPAMNAYHLPDSISDEVAAILDPLGNATHTALSFDLVGEDVLVTGAGPIGIMAVAIARHVGARHVVVTDVNDYRLDLARKKKRQRRRLLKRSNRRLKRRRKNRLQRKRKLKSRLMLRMRPKSSLILFNLFFKILTITFS